MTRWYDLVTAPAQLQSKMAWIPFRMRMETSSTSTSRSSSSATSRADCPLSSHNNTRILGKSALRPYRCVETHTNQKACYEREGNCGVSPALGTHQVTSIG